MCRYRFSLFIIFSLSLLFLGGCTKKTDDCIDSNGSAPVLSAVQVSPAAVNTDTIGIHPSANDTLTLQFALRVKVYHPGGESSISSVPFSVVNTHTLESLCDGVLSKSGTSSDSIFTGTALLSLPRSYIGTLNVVITANSKEGFSSSAEIYPVAITRTNHIPVVDSVIIPDTIHVTKVSSMTMTAQVSDTDGIADISAVYQVTQDGTLHKLTANGDGSYSRTTTWSTSNYSSSFPVQSVVYYFVAFDYSQVMSSVITKTVVLAP
jgi:hypothetical protein